MAGATQSRGFASGSKKALSTCGLPIEVPTVCFQRRLYCGMKVDVDLIPSVR